MAILEFYPHENANTPDHTQEIYYLDDAKRLMEFLEFDACIALRSEPMGGVLDTNYINGYAIRSYDDLFAIQDLYKARDKNWRVLFDMKRLY